LWVVLVCINNNSYYFHTIQSILKLLLQLIGLKFDSRFPYYSVYFKAHSSLPVQFYVLVNFHTIQSILKRVALWLENFFWMNFHTIQSILKPDQDKKNMYIILQFPYYSVYFKARRVKRNEMRKNEISILFSLF